jgi:hypothetical protein
LGRMRWTPSKFDAFIRKNFIEMKNGENNEWKKSDYFSEFERDYAGEEKQLKIEAQKKRNSELDAIHKKLDMIIAMIQNIEGNKEEWLPPLATIRLS